MNFEGLYAAIQARLVLENPISTPGSLDKELKLPEQSPPLSVPFGLRHAASRR